MMLAIMAVDSDSKGDDGPMFMPQRQGRTGADGRARVEGLEPGSYTVRASCAPFADGWGEARVTAGVPPDPVIVQLTLGGKVEGRVLPAAGEPSPPPPTNVSLFRRGREMPISTVKSGADGGFAFERVSPGEHRVAGPSGGTVTVALMTPGQPPRVLWRAVLPPGAELPDAMRCAGPPSPTCVLAPDAGLGVGPFTIALRATGDAGVQVSQVRYVWRAEVAP